ncbi:hypothetical protein Pfo_010410 [Paulownia fortunei]|nr:hypothetical protein Pfo_010410 [Paulownia fortunei]
MTTGCIPVAGERLIWAARNLENGLFDMGMGGWVACQRGTPTVPRFPSPQLIKLSNLIGWYEHDNKHVWLAKKALPMNLRWILNDPQNGITGSQRSAQSPLRKQESVQLHQNNKEFEFSAEKSCHKMRTKVNDASAAAAFSKNFKRRRPIPQRGQIKMKIAAKAFQSLVSIVSASSAQYLGSPRKKSQY